MGKTVLIVDDEKNIVEAVRYNLEREGYRTLVAFDGVHGLELARQELPDVMVLDWMLPGLDGLEICRRLAAEETTRHIPIILLTVRADETDKVLGLEMGACDYVTKPFSTRELVARVKANLRRNAPRQVQDTLELGELRADWARHRVTWSGDPVELTSKEFNLLKALWQARGRVLDREQLLNQVWGYDHAANIGTRTVDLHVSQLRRKLPVLTSRLVTVKNAGYRLDLD